MTKVESILQVSPKFLKEYCAFYYNINHLKNNETKRISAIYNFLLFLAKNLEKNVNELSVLDLENIELSIIQVYFTTGEISKLSLGSQKLLLSHLSAFWTYFTNDSFTVQKGKPIFYRNAINEWKIAFSKTYSKISNQSEQTSRPSHETLNEEDLKKFLNFVEFSYILSLDTHKKIENWKKVEERDLAILGILIGSGITVEELSKLDWRDVDMRKKVVYVFRNGERVIIPVLDFVVPYISPYLKTRRAWYFSHRLKPSLFVNHKGNRPSPPFYIGIINKFNKVYPQKLISASNIRKAHGQIILKQTGDYREIQRLHGTRSANSLMSYL